jgi:hypothetical protein
VLDWPGLAGTAVITAALAHRIAPTRGWRSPYWPTTLTVLALATLALRGTTLLDHLHHTASTPDRNALVAAAVPETAALLIVAIPLAIRSARTLRLTTGGVRC